MNLETTALNVPLLFSLILSVENATHAQKDISTTQPQTDVSVKFHVRPQDRLTQPQNNANALPIKKE